jgi:hypothetical protein
MCTTYSQCVNTDQCKEVLKVGGSSNVKALHLSVAAIIVFFRQYIPIMRHILFGLKICKLCCLSNCIYDRSRYFVRDRQNVSETITYTHAVLKRPIDRLKGGLPALFDDPHVPPVNCCQTVAQNDKWMCGCCERVTG